MTVTLDYAELKPPYSIHPVFLGGKEYRIATKFCGNDLDSLQDFIEQDLKKKIVRSDRRGIATRYYGRYWHILPYSSQEQILRKIPCAYEYLHGRRGFFHWRDVLKAIPKRPRCHICHAPPTKWKTTAHGKRISDSNNRWNCLKEPSNEFLSEQRVLETCKEARNEVLRAAERMREYYWQLKNERAEEGQWIKISKRRLRAIKAYLKNPTEHPEL